VYDFEQVPVTLPVDERTQLIPPSELVIVPAPRPAVETVKV